MKTIFAILFCAVALFLAYMWLKSPQGAREVDRVLGGQDKLDQTINEQWRG